MGGSDYSFWQGQDKPKYLSEIRNYYNIMCGCPCSSNIILSATSGQNDK